MSNPFTQLTSAGDDASKLTTLAARNKNPGNLRVPGSNDWQTFNTPDEGYQALIDDLKAKQAGKSRVKGMDGNTSLLDMIKHYAPEDDHNDPVKYTASVAAALSKSSGKKVDASTPIGQLDAEQLAPHIAHVEDHNYWSEVGDKVLSGRKKTTNPFSTLLEQSPTVNPFHALVAPESNQVPNVINPITGDILPTVEHSGGLNAIINEPATLVKNTVNAGIGTINMGTRALAETGGDPLNAAFNVGGQLLKGAAGEGSLVEKAGNLLGGLWHQVVANPINVTVNTLKQIPGAYLLPSIGPLIARSLAEPDNAPQHFGINLHLNPKGDGPGSVYNEVQQLLGNGIALAAGHAFGASAPAGSVNELYAKLGIPEGASALDIVTKYLPPALDGLPAKSKVAMLNTLKTPLGTTVSNAMTSGFAGGAAFALSQDSDPNSIAQNAFQMGIAGGAIGGALGKIFKSKVKSGELNNPTADAIAQSIIRNGGDVIKAKGIMKMADAVASGVDLVTSYKDNIEPGKVAVMQSIPSIRTEHLTDPEIGTYRRADGSYDVLVQHPTDPQLTPEEVKQFSNEGFVQNEVVTTNGQRYVYDGQNERGNAKLISLATGETDLAQPRNIRRSDTFYRAIPDADGQGFTVDPRFGSVGKFSPKVYKTLSPEERAAVDKVIVDDQVAKATAAQNTAKDLMSEGYYISSDAGPNGGYIIKKIGDPTISHTMPTVDHIKEFARNRIASNMAPDLIAQVQAKAAPDLRVNEANASSLQPLSVINGTSRTRIGFDNVNNSALGVRFAPITKALASISRVTGMEMGDLLSKLEDAHRSMQAAGNTIGGIAQKALDPLMKLDPLQARIAEDYASSASAEELLNGKFYDNDTKIHPEALNHARKLIDNVGGISADPDIINQQTKDLNTGIVLARETAWLQHSLDQGSIDPQMFARSMTKLKADLNVTSTHENIAAALKTAMDAGVPLVEPVTISEKLLKNDPTREQFAATHNVSPEIIEAVRKHDELYRGLSDRFGIQNPIRNYVARIVKHSGDALDNQERMMAFKFAGPKEVQFAQALHRVGYYDPSALYHDLPSIFNRYLNAGLKAQNVAPVLEEARQRLQQFSKEIDPQTGLAKYDRTSVDKLSKIWQDVSSDVQGYRNPLDAKVQTAIDADAAKGKKSGFGRLTDELGRLWAFKGVAFRPIVGIAHFVSGIMSAGMSFGPEYASKMMGNLEQGLRIGRQLQEAGITPGGDVAAQLANTNPAATAGASKLVQGYDAVVKAGFKGTALQPMYRMLHTAAYITTTEEVGAAISEFASKKINAEQLAEKVRLDMFDPGDQKAFIEKVQGDTPNFSDATDFLARRAGEKVVGHFGVVNNPMLLRTVPGRMFGQFGSYKMYQLQQIADALSNGSGLSRAKRLTFLAGSGLALAGASQISGLDLNHFALWDASKIFDLFEHPPTNVMEGAGRVLSSGMGNILPPVSPASQFLMNLSDASNPDSPTSHYAAKKLGDAFLNPIPSEISSLIDATARFGNGDPAHVVGMKLLGGNVDSHRYKSPSFSLWDLWP